MSEGQKKLRCCLLASYWKRTNHGVVETLKKFAYHTFILNGTTRRQDEVILRDYMSSMVQTLFPASKAVLQYVNDTDHTVVLN